MAAMPTDFAKMGLAFVTMAGVELIAPSRPARTSVPAMENADVGFAIVTSNSEEKTVPRHDARKIATSVGCA